MITIKTILTTICSPPSLDDMIEELSLQRLSRAAGADAGFLHVPPDTGALQDGQDG